MCRDLNFKLRGEKKHDAHRDVTELVKLFGELNIQLTENHKQFNDSVRIEGRK